MCEYRIRDFHIPSCLATGQRRVQIQFDTPHLSEAEAPCRQGNRLEHVTLLFMVVATFIRKYCWYLVLLMYRTLFKLLESVYAGCKIKPQA